MSVYVVASRRNTSSANPIFLCLQLGRLDFRLAADPTRGLPDRRFLVALIQITWYALRGFVVSPQITAVGRPASM